MPSAYSNKNPKIVVVGNAAVGKSTFVNCVTEPGRIGNYNTEVFLSRSIACNYYTKLYGVRRTTLIDCVHPSSFSNARQTDGHVGFWSDVNGAIIMVDYNSPTTLADIQRYAADLQGTFPGIPMVVVYNKIDLFVAGNPTPPELADESVVTTFAEPMSDIAGIFKTAQHSPNRETSYWCVVDFMCNLICKKPKSAPAPAPAPAPPASEDQQGIAAMEQGNAEMRQQFEVLCTTLRDRCESTTEENRKAFQQEMNEMRQAFEHMCAQFQSVIDKAKASQQGTLDTSDNEAVATNPVV